MSEMWFLHFLLFLSKYFPFPSVAKILRSSIYFLKYLKYFKVFQIILEIFQHLFTSKNHLILILYERTLSRVDNVSIT